MHDLAEHGRRHIGDSGIVDGDERGRTRQSVDRSQFAEELPVANVAQYRLHAGDRLDLYSHLAMRDEMEFRPAFIVVENGFLRLSRTSPIRRRRLRFFTRRDWATR
jgi:hypothetical protein